MSNLCGRGPYQKGTRFKRMEKRRRATNDLERLIERAREKGPERAYLDWLRTQPSALDGSWGYDTATWQQANDPAHWRSSRYCGTGQKAEFLAVPLSPTQHRLAHQHGDGVIGDKAWWERQVMIHLRRWIDS